MLDYNIAKKARQKGFSGMTRMYGGYHTVKGNDEDLVRQFYDEGVFIQITIQPDKTFKCEAIVLETMEVIQEVAGDDYSEVLDGVFNRLLDDLPDDKKVTM